jgi:hypothetical protein
MGLFDFFKKKPSAAPPSATEDDVRAEGWDAITRAFEQVYPGQTDPAHRAPLIHRMHDLSKYAAAFDGVSAYDAGDHWHLVTFGLSELYDKEGEDPEISGFGYELTFKLPKVSEQPPPWAFAFLDGIGRAVWDGQVFAPGHTIKTGPLDGHPTTVENALLVLSDPSFPAPICSANGKLELLLLLGVDNAVRERVLAAHAAAPDSDWYAPIVAELRESNPALVTPIRSVGDWGGR